MPSNDVQHIAMSLGLYCNTVRDWLIANCCGATKLSRLWVHGPPRNKATNPITLEAITNLNTTLIVIKL